MHAYHNSVMLSPAPLMSPPIATWNQPPHTSQASLEFSKARGSKLSCSPAHTVWNHKTSQHWWWSVQLSWTSFAAYLPHHLKVSLLGKLFKIPSASEHSILPRRDPWPQTAYLDISPEFDSGLSLDVSGVSTPGVSTPGVGANRSICGENALTPAWSNACSWSKCSNGQPQCLWRECPQTQCLVQALKWSIPTSVEGVHLDSNLIQLVIMPIPWKRPYFSKWTIQFHSSGCAKSAENSDGPSRITAPIPIKVGRWSDAEQQWTLHSCTC